MPGGDMVKQVHRYSLAWVSLGALGLAALAAWWLAFEPPATPTPSPSETAQAATSTGLWQAAGKPPASPQTSLSTAATVAPSATADASAHAATASAAAPDAGVLNHGFISASLQALAANGLRLDTAQVSLHTVQTTDLATAHALGRWARSQGFSVRSPIKVLEHGGEVTWVLPIERQAVLAVPQILADGHQIVQQVSQTPGARYHTWQVPLNGRSTLAGLPQS
ncbi:MAG: hypothetical protein C4K60_19160 [Ideonella sp. MAG2]|nr:MAG: hypothetical protein C4K60_19160 [Ideonella sp. MAG2]